MSLNTTRSDARHVSSQARSSIVSSTTSLPTGLILNMEALNTSAEPRSSSTIASASIYAVKKTVHTYSKIVLRLRAGRRHIATAASASSMEAAHIPMTTLLTYHLLQPINLGMSLKTKSMRRKASYSTFKTSLATPTMPKSTMKT